MKSLNKVQTMAKIFEIVAKVVYIMSIVGISVCGVGLVLTLALGNTDMIKNLITKISEKNDVNKATVVSYLIFAILECVASLIVYKKEYNLYNMEISLNNPFEKKFVEEIRKVAITRIITACALSVSIGIVSVILNIKGEYKVSVSSSIGIGIVYLLVSLILEYGVEIKEKDSEENNA